MGKSGDSNKLRYARKPIEATCVMFYQGHAHVMHVVNISASGILLNGSKAGELGLEVGSQCVLEIIINEEFNLNVDAELVRIDDDGLAMCYTHIPEDKQVPLWRLLGEHVDKTEI